MRRSPVTTPTALLLTPQQIQQRQPVWEAVSELWLDTELDARDLLRIATVLIESPFTVDELRDIYRYEVAPVVSNNLRSVAGEWGGFDGEWLRERIVADLARPRPLVRRWRRSALSQWWHTGMTEAQWGIVEATVRHVRAVQ